MKYRLAEGRRGLSSDGEGAKPIALDSRRRSWI